MLKGYERTNGNLHRNVIKKRSIVKAAKRKLQRKNNLVEIEKR